MPRSPAGPVQRPFKQLFLMAVLALFLPLVVVLVGVEFAILQGRLFDEYRRLQDQTEMSIEQTLRIADQGFQVLERSLDGLLLRNLELVSAEFRRVGGVPSRMRLEGLKDELDYGMDIYVIDRGGKVVATTDPADLGLDLSQFSDFWAGFQSKLSLGRPWTVRISPSVVSGEIKKYAYAPSDDGRYVLELGLVSRAYSNLLPDLTTQSLAPALRRFNPWLLDVRFFDPRANRLIDQPGQTLPEEITQALEAARRPPHDYETRDPATGNDRHYHFIRLGDPTFGDDTSRIVELSYDRGPIHQLLAELLLVQLGLGAVVIALVVLFGILAAARLTRPIGSLVEQIGQLDDRLFSTRISIEGENELQPVAQRLNQWLERLRQSNAEREAHLQDAEKMAVLGNLIASVAHDLNNPMGMGITASSFLVSRTQALSESAQAGSMTRADFQSYLQDCQESSQIIQRNLEQAAHLVRSFKRLAVDQSSGEAYSFELGGLVEDIYQCLHPMFRKTQAALELDCDLEFEAQANPALLSQILTNLTMNSLIHGLPEDGRPALVRVALRLEPDFLVIEHSDNGPGIPPEKHALVFQAHYTTLRGQGGSGLGLFVVKSVVEEQLKGSLALDSSPGRGARFVIRIPLAMLRDPARGP